MKQLIFAIKATKIIFNNKQAYLNLLQIYLFFQPNKIYAQEYYDKLNIPPHHSSFNSNKKSFQLIIDNLEELSI